MDSARTEPVSPGFADLIAPLTVEAFVRDVFRRDIRHFAGAPERGQAVLDWDDMNRLLNMDIWNANTLSLTMDGKRAPPAAFCVQRSHHSKVPGIYPDPQRVLGFLRQGASLVMESLAPLLPRVERVAADLRSTFNGHVGANLYYSPRETQAFATHFDRHEVFALQIYGEKRWRVYKGGPEFPIEHPMFHNLPRAQLEALAGPVEHEALLKPGDLLYLPRGRMHDARAVTDFSLHITFSCVPATGANLLQDVASRLIERAVFRKDLPDPRSPGGEAELKARMAELLAEINAVYGGDAGVSLVKDLLGAYTRRPVPAFDMPSDGPAPQSRPFAYRQG